MTTGTRRCPVRLGRTWPTAARLWPGSLRCAWSKHAQPGTGTSSQSTTSRPGHACWRRTCWVTTHGWRASARNRRKRKWRWAAQKALALETAGDDGRWDPGTSRASGHRYRSRCMRCRRSGRGPAALPTLASGEDSLPLEPIPGLSTAPDNEGRASYVIREKDFSCGPAGSRT